MVLPSVLFLLVAVAVEQGLRENCDTWTCKKGTNAQVRFLNMTRLTKK
jgi:hypothetical protein